MPKYEEILTAVRPKLESFADNYAELLQANILQVIQKEVLPALKVAYLAKYDELVDIVEALTPSALKGKDPLSLKEQRDLFEKQLSSELEKSSFEGGQFSLSIRLTGEEGDKGAASSPSSLNFYIEGWAEGAAFITPEHKRQRNPTSSARLGRVGGGFLITETAYKNERWLEITGIPFADVRHPISGFRPFTGFEEIPELIDFSAALQKALENTNASLDGTTV